MVQTLRYSVSLVTQGRHKFYTLTMPSDVLAKTCFVTTRDEDPQEGFQRVLDKDRAKQIADYIDIGLGTIPNSIVLSAQSEANLRVIGKGKTVEFHNARKAFLILDGQHRVFGFSMAKTALRVPVVIYNGLSRKDETRLFIDINTKQRPVPNELLLDIKRLAEYETDTEKLLTDVFDYFHRDSSSPLLGLVSPSKKEKGKLSRVTFNAALKPLVTAFEGYEGQEIYEIVSAYLRAFVVGAEGIKAPNAVTNPVIFRAVMLLFKEVAQRVKDRYGKSYSEQNFLTVLGPLLSRVRVATLRQPGPSYRDVYEALNTALKSDFIL